MEEYRPAICMIRIRDGVIAKYHYFCDLTMCENCEYWHLKEGSFGMCDNLGLITISNFSCIDGTKREE